MHDKPAPCYSASVNKISLPPNRRTIFLLLAFWVLTYGLLAGAPAHAVPKPDPPVAAQGVLDLTNWNAEYRDLETGTHLERIREYSRILARELAGHPNYSGYITDRYIDDLFHSSILHDIGKVGVPDSILLKPASLTPEEFRIIQQHVMIGGDSIKGIEAKMNMESFLTLGREIAYYHHEKWDGSGYPKRIKGEDSPLSARIVALADVYDALTSERPYKKAMSHEKAAAIILDGRGKHFDPLMVDIFSEKQAVFDDVRRSYRETPVDTASAPEGVSRS